MSLATDYRPKDFSDVVGQSTIVNTLVKEFENNSIKQSYLFMGQSGAGKSTCSMIIANKGNGQTLMIDTAVNNSAEDVRNIVDSIQTKPLLYNKVVVIFHKIHTLSPKRFSSLFLIL